MQINTDSSGSFGRLFMPTNYQIGKVWGKSACKHSRIIHDAVSNVADDLDVYIMQIGQNRYNVKVGPKLPSATVNPEKRSDLINIECAFHSIAKKIQKLKNSIYSA